MKKIFAIVCTLFIFINLSAQEQNIEGTYRNGSDSLTLKNGKASFCLSGFGALFTKISGEGLYEKENDYLLIHTGEYSKPKTTFQELQPEKKDTVQINIYSSDGFVMNGVLTEMLNKSGKIIERAISNDNGNIIVPKNDKIASVRISNMGYDGIEFDLQPQKDYTVNMVENQIIENKTIVIRLKPVEEDIVLLLLLSDDFKIEKDKSKSIEKLVKKAEKMNLLDKRFRKEYISVYGR